ncbi:hypothetical protein [Paenibacillus sp. MABNR03]|uniref:hypothetical protein n=1 Tax=Paenibacillus sp. MABNR03 TaxID=3142626 RepID=UPI003D2B29DD
MGTTLDSAKTPQDKLTVQFHIEIKHEFQNISKHKRVRMPVVKCSMPLYINGSLLDEREVFVESVFFQSLLQPGKFPMFTFTCGIFGCGGYYVDVLHNDTTVTWITEQSPFMDASDESSNVFIFSWSNLLNFAEELIRGYEEIARVRLAHNLQYNNDLELYRNIIHRKRIEVDRA